MNREKVEAAASRLLQRHETGNVTGLWIRRVAVDSYRVTNTAGTVAIAQKRGTSQVTVTLLDRGERKLAEDQSSDRDSTIVRLFEVMPELCDLYEASHPSLQNVNKDAADNLIDGL